MARRKRAEDKSSAPAPSCPRVWVSMLEAIRYAGSVDALRAARKDVARLTRLRCRFLLSSGAELPDLWAPSWLDNAAVDRNTGRATLKHPIHGYIIIVDIEWDLDELVAAFADTKPAPRKRGQKGYRVWDDVWNEFDPLVEKGRRWHSANSAANDVLQMAQNSNTVIPATRQSAPLKSRRLAPVDSARLNDTNKSLNPTD